MFCKFYENSSKFLHKFISQLKIWQLSRFNTDFLLIKIETSGNAGCLYRQTRLDSSAKIVDCNENYLEIY